ncbi:MAG: DUF885 domain-containing protein [Phenylobacterium sp.]|uniref:DUF885 domain-containing protein n=1 Tax=Phenylobacterium sp. TaxID=1871053 RepID=UPI0025E5987E|nr:DUF885 domain-containing protein [Phenylobacterium sp.]MBA4010629.1 DUF885 domain-containing protein [Phenylobacterium sp.]
MDRRKFLLAGAGAVALGVGGPGYAAEAQSAELQALCDSTYDAFLRRSPILCSSFGVDNGPYAALKSQLDGDTPADREAYRGLLETALKGLGRLDRGRLSATDRINYDTLAWQWSTLLSGVRDFSYGVKSPSQPQSPWVLSHLSGMAQALPDFFDSNHRIATSADAEAYLARLERFGPVLGDEVAHFHDDVRAGARPPAFILKRGIATLKAWRGQSDDATLIVASLVRRTNEKGIDGTWGAQAKSILATKIRPALEAQIAALEAELPKATDDAGVWRLPEGDAYYAHQVRNGTSTNLTPAEIHKMGLEMVADLRGRADALLRAQGLSQGSVGDRLASLFTDPRFIAPNTDAGRESVMASARSLMAGIQKRLPEAFSTLPKAQVIVRRPPPINEGASAPYYLAGTVDGSRPGAYYLQLADTASTPSWTLPTTTFHEAYPGHHLQNSLLIENRAIPLVRKLNLCRPNSDFNAYDEGWALYAEQLADELGMYADDPLGRIGYLNDQMFRAARLVVDTGLHHLRWSRAQAVDYMTGVTGKRSEAETEIDRYCVWPGQALGYMIGKVQWLDLRAAMKARQGSAFDIRQFHAVGLDAGSTSLDVLRRVYREQGLI